MDRRFDMRLEERHGLRGSVGRRLVGRVVVPAAIIYAVLSAAGAMEEIGKLLGYFFGTGETGTRDPEPIAINGGAVFTWLFIGGLVFTAVWSVINVFVAFLYNLISDIVGGIDVTLAEKPPR